MKHLRTLVVAVAALVSIPTFVDRAVDASSLETTSASNPGSAAVPSIDGQVTFLYYKDVDTAARFYEDILRLDKSFDEGWVRIYEVTEGASVGLVDELRGQHGTSEDKPVMLSIVTNEIDAWYQHMVASGAPILSELGESADAPIRAFVVEDPGGYTVEFFQWISQ